MRRSRVPAPLHDPTLTRKAQLPGNSGQRTKHIGVAWGWFVDYGGDVGMVLRSSRGGGPWTQDSVRMLCGAFGYDDEGVQIAPRPWVYAGDEVVVQGDCFLIEFIDGNSDLPIIMGGVRTLKPADPAFFAGQAIGEDPNPIRLRKAIRDPKTGAISGHLQVRALDGGTTLEVVVGGPTWGEGIRFLLDYVAGQIKFGKGKELAGSPLGDKTAQAFLDITTDLATIAGALPVAIPPTALATFQLAIDAATSVGSLGAPLLSDITKVE